MNVQQALIHRLIGSRRALRPAAQSLSSPRKSEGEGGCGVVGVACNEKIAGRHLLPALEQMRNRGNGKGGGIAAVGLSPEQFGVTQEILEQDYLLNVAYLDASAQAQVEREHIELLFEVDHVRCLPHEEDSGTALVGPPEVIQYFVRVKPAVVSEFVRANGLEEAAAAGQPPSRIDDEIVYQHCYRLNQIFYASGHGRRALVLSHGKNLLVLKLVGYGDDVIRYYQLRDLLAHVWIGHHRYPTKGRVWHPGGAHPFSASRYALVHNGDFANYASICEYLSQKNIYPLFFTDTEVSVLVFDLLHRTFGYPLEYAIESLAPTTERDFTLLPKDKQELYRLLQAAHIHGSPDGPWFFLLAESAVAERAYRLIGITDTSMLRPQVFALQEGEASVGLVASEKQAIDAVLESLSSEDDRFWPRADLFWNARGGSHTDGGAFVFTVQCGQGGSAELRCTDKFGRPLSVEEPVPPPEQLGTSGSLVPPDLDTAAIFRWAVAQIPAWDYEGLSAFLHWLRADARADGDRKRAIDVITLLMDRRYNTGSIRHSYLLSLLDQALSSVLEEIRKSPSDLFVSIGARHFLPGATLPASLIAVLDARDFAADGEHSLARSIVTLYERGLRKFIIAQARGHRFIGSGLGPRSQGVSIDVYGSSGDYLASGIDGAHVTVHGSGQDQLAQIMKSGMLVVHGDVGQTFMYSAKGGMAFVLGNAAGRPLINAVGRPRVVINGTCLDYLAESFMAGDPLSDGGFVIVNGVTFNKEGQLEDLPEPYPGCNLFSLASGGAIYIRDPHGKLSEEQLNGGRFVILQDADWNVIKPYLEKNEKLFGIALEALLTVNGRICPPERVYRKISPEQVEALQAEEAWVKMRE